MFFIDNYAAQICAFGKHCRARTDQHLGIAGAHCLPAGKTLGIGHTRMMRHHRHGQAPAQTCHHRLHQADFRHQHHHLPAVGGEAFNMANINFRFARAGYAFKQNRAARAIGQHRQRRLLFVG